MQEGREGGPWLQHLCKPDILKKSERALVEELAPGFYGDADGLAVGRFATGNINGAEMAFENQVEDVLGGAADAVGDLERRQDAAVGKIEAREGERLLAGFGFRGANGKLAPGNGEGTRTAAAKPDNAGFFGAQTADFFEAAAFHGNQL